jgi:hypothetical protein
MLANLIASFSAPKAGTASSRRSWMMLQPEKVLDLAEFIRRAAKSAKASTHKRRCDLRHYGETQEQASG